MWVPKAFNKVVLRLRPKFPGWILEFMRYDAIDLLFTLKTTMKKTCCLHRLQYQSISSSPESTHPAWVPSSELIFILISILSFWFHTPCMAPILGIEEKKRIQQKKKTIWAKVVLIVECKQPMVDVSIHKSSCIQSTWCWVALDVVGQVLSSRGAPVAFLPALPA